MLLQIDTNVSIAKKIARRRQYSRAVQLPRRVGLIALEKLAIGNELENHPRSSKMTLLNKLLHIYHYFTLVACNNNFTMLHRIRDIITTFSAVSQYVIAYDLQHIYDIYSCGHVCLSISV